MNDFSDLTYTFTDSEMEEHDSEVRKEAVQEVVDYLEEAMEQSKENEQGMTYAVLNAVKIKTEQLRNRVEAVAAGHKKETPGAAGNKRESNMAAGDTKEPETVTKVIEEVCDDICRHYCKYTNESWIGFDELSETCDHCPLNRLN